MLLTKTSLFIAEPPSFFWFKPPSPSVTDLHSSQIHTCSSPLTRLDSPKRCRCSNHRSASPCKHGRAQCLAQRSKPNDYLTSVAGLPDQSEVPRASGVWRRKEGVADDKVCTSCVIDVYYVLDHNGVSALLCCQERQHVLLSLIYSRY